MKINVRYIVIVLLVIFTIAATTVPAMAEVVIVRPTPALDDLTDVDATAPGDGYFLVWNGTAGVWVDYLLVLNLDDLEDVDASSPANGQIITWNSTSSQWEVNDIQAGLWEDTVTSVSLIDAKNVDMAYDQILRLGTPTTPASATTKQYVDDLVAAVTEGLWEIDGSESQLITADEIDMQSKAIINLLDPSLDQDAATKKYVDDELAGFTPASPTSIWDSDTDTGIQTEESADEDILRFDTAGAEAMTIDDSQDVTIYGGDLTLDKTAATIYLGSGADDGPHGLIFADGSGTNQMQLLYRSSPNQLIVEDATDESDILAIDVDDYSSTFGGDIVFGTTNEIRADTSDGSDDQRVSICGGGALSSSRGAYISLEGNEYAGNNGRLTLTSGAVSGADTIINANDDIEMDAGEYVYISANGNDVLITAGDDIFLMPEHYQGKIRMYYLSGTTSGSYLRWYSNTLYYYSSSERYKANIQPLNDDWYSILELEPKIFTDKATGETDIGYIAEDADALGLTELVGYRDDIEGYEGENIPDTLEYQLITIYLQQIIKDQQATIEAQQEEINNLQADIQAIKGYLGI